MVIAVGLSSYNIALFHLVNHAFYKGLLFLGAGAVIHAVADNQDFRKYGGLRPFLPLTYSVMLIASLSLVAFPFMTGFYSKDFILESAYGQFYFTGTVVYFIATIGAMFTTLYSVKVLYLTFLTNPNGPVVNYKHAHEGDIFMSLPLIILAIFSIFFGYISKDIFIGLGSAFFADNSLFIHPRHEIMLDTEFAVPTFFKLLPLFFTISLSFLAIILSEFLPKILVSFKFSRLGYNIFGFFNQRFLIELFYNKYITGLVLKLGGQTSKVLDKGSVELLGPFGLEKGLITLSRNISSLDTGVITTYALYILMGFIFYIIIPSLNIFDHSLLILILLSLFCIVNTSSNTKYNASFISGFGFMFTPVDLTSNSGFTSVDLTFNPNSGSRFTPVDFTFNPDFGSRFTPVDFTFNPNLENLYSFLQCLDISFFNLALSPSNIFNFILSTVELQFIVLLTMAICINTILAHFMLDKQTILIGGRAGDSLLCTRDSILLKLKEQIRYNRRRRADDQFDIYSHFYANTAFVPMEKAYLRQYGDRLRGFTMINNRIWDNTPPRDIAVASNRLMWEIYQQPRY